MRTTFVSSERAIGWIPALPRPAEATHNPAMSSFTALMLTQAGRATDAALVWLDESALPQGNVDVRVEYSSLNFKDALAITGRGAIVKRWPLVPGIDLAGIVERSEHPAWKPGDRVLVNGWGLGETHWGGLSQRARLDGDWLLALPSAYDSLRAMAIGTAGYTVALSVMALQRHGLTPADGPVLVTGASGGVGSVAVVLLAGLGFQVAASTGRAEQAGYLRDLGATESVERSSMATAGKPLQSERWAGVVDTVGSHTLANACAATRWNGARSGDAVHANLTVEGLPDGHSHQRCGRHVTRSGECTQAVGRAAKIDGHALSGLGRHGVDAPGSCARCNSIDPMLSPFCGFIRQRSACTGVGQSDPFRPSDSRGLSSAVAIRRCQSLPRRPAPH